MATLPLAKVKALSTDAEYDLVKASRRPEINQLDTTTLKKHIAKARKLRDKWRDQSTKQRRNAQKQHSARVADGEHRSHQKVEVFDTALAAFEKRLDKATANGSATTVSKKAVKRSVAKSATLTSTTPSKTFPKKKATVGKSGVYAATVTRTAKETVDRPTEAEATKKPTKGKQSEGLVGPVNAKKQRRAETAAKQERLDRSGVTTRVQGSISSQERRKQAKRDARG